MKLQCTAIVICVSKRLEKATATEIKLFSVIPNTGKPTDTGRCYIP